MMGKTDDYRMFALRVQNITRSCILLKQHMNGIWTMPIVIIKKTDDPMNHLPKILEQVARDDSFELISMVSMLQWMQEDRDGVEHHSIVCDLRYAGKVLPHMTEYDTQKYADSRWVQKGMLDQYKGKANYPLYAYIEAAEKESCLS